VSKNHRTTAAKVTVELIIYLEDPFSTKTVLRELHKSNIHVIAGNAKPQLMKATLKGEKYGVVIIKPGRLTIGNM
jgi:hypothetical protein